MNESSREIHALQEKVRLLENELHLKSDFLSIAVHQLRTPLAANKWIFKMMMDGDLGSVTTEQRNIISRGFQSNEQMIRMLAEISHANHMSEWKLSFDPKPVDITSCIENTVSEFLPEARLRKILLVADINPSLPLVLADRDKVCLVIQNLVENAIKYNRIGGKVTIHVQVLNDTMVTSVTDTGIGIPLDYQREIFKKFYRAPNAKEMDKGTGLGLFVGREIIEQHRGQLWFESTQNIGTTFFFSLPLAK